LMVLVLEATRRTVGWILPVTAVGFLAYAQFGAVLDRLGLSLIGLAGWGWTGAQSATRERVLAGDSIVETA